MKYPRAIAFVVDGAADRAALVAFHAYPAFLKPTSVPARSSGVTRNGETAMTTHSHSRIGISAVLILAVILCGGGAIWAQGLGSVVGTVTDPSGGVVPSAKVKVTDEGTSLTREATTNVQGMFV